MKKVLVFHNPKAGKESYGKNDLMTKLVALKMPYDYVPRVGSIWKNSISSNANAIVLAGGDGTIRAMVRELLAGQIEQTMPIALLPTGTANNIAKTLGIEMDAEQTIDFNGKMVNFDCGSVQGVLSESFFLEGVGVGIFPELMAEAEKHSIERPTPSAELKAALKKLKTIVKEYETKKVELLVDGQYMEGAFLLVEIMNTQYIGPNLKLAPQAAYDDGLLDVVMVREKDRNRFVDYLDKLIAGGDAVKSLKRFVKPLRAKKVKMRWAGTRIHVDDQLIHTKPYQEITLEIAKKHLKFVV